MPASTHWIFQTTYNGEITWASAGAVAGLGYPSTGQLLHKDISDVIVFPYASVLVENICNARLLAQECRSYQDEMFLYNSRSATRRITAAAVTPHMRIQPEIITEVLREDLLSYPLLNVPAAIINANGKAIQANISVWIPGKYIPGRVQIILIPVYQNGHRPGKVEIIQSFYQAIDELDHETASHCATVSDLSCELAIACGLPASEAEKVRRASLIHDGGKLFIPDPIKNKPGPLTSGEMDLIRRHARYLLFLDGITEEMDIAIAHHELWDGRGYPFGLKRREIPLLSRIMTVADVWHALVTERPYKAAWPVDEAEAHFRKNAGKLFDPDLVPIFLNLILN